MKVEFDPSSREVRLALIGLLLLLGLKHEDILVLIGL